MNYQEEAKKFLAESIVKRLRSKNYPAYECGVTLFAEYLDSLEKEKYERIVQPIHREDPLDNKCLCKQGDGVLAVEEPAVHTPTFCGPKPKPKKIAELSIWGVHQMDALWKLEDKLNEIITHLNEKD